MLCSALRLLNTAQASVQDGLSQDLSNRHELTYLMLFALQLILNGWTCTNVALQLEL